MSMRAVDAEPYLRAKEKLRTTLAETDCDAVFQNGVVVPVFIQDGGSQLYIEQNLAFTDPEKIPGFVRFVQKPITQPEVTPEPRRLKGSTTQELVADAANREAAARGERERGRLAVQGITSQAVIAGNALYEQRAQDIARARNPESRRKHDWRQS